MEINPPTTIPMRTSGSKTTVTRNFDIPQAAFTPNIHNLPNTQNKHITNNNDNIFSPFYMTSIKKLTGRKPSLQEIMADLGFLIHPS